MAKQQPRSKASVLRDLRVACDYLHLVTWEPGELAKEEAREVMAIEQALNELLARLRR